VLAGIDVGELGVFRWLRYPVGIDQLGDFSDPAGYPWRDTIAMSVHDSTTHAAHLEHLIAPERAVYPNGDPYSRLKIGELWSERAALLRFLGRADLPPSVDLELYRETIQRPAGGASLNFALQLADVLAFDEEYRRQAQQMRINIPGTVNTREEKSNWVGVIPDLDEMFALSSRRALAIRDEVRQVMIASGRCAEDR
jgi:hypothetical protein